MGNGLLLAPDQKPSWNRCQLAKSSFSLKTKIPLLFRLGFLFPIDNGATLTK